MLHDLHITDNLFRSVDVDATISDMEIDGFSDSIDFVTKFHECNLMMSVEKQLEWLKGFESERDRVERDSVVVPSAGDNAADASNVDGNRSAKSTFSGQKTTQQVYEARSKLPNRDTLVCVLEEPIGWPRVEKDADGIEFISSTGLPGLALIMQVDIAGGFRFDKTVAAFNNSFGELPARAMLELTKMLYKSAEVVNSLPDSIFLSSPEIMTEYDRVEKFKPGTVVLLIIL